LNVFFVQKDVGELEKLFKKLNIRTETYHDLTKVEIIDRTEKFIQHQEFSNASMSVFVLMGHGGDDSHIIAGSGTRIKTEDIIDLFDDRNCPNLEGKPKWFIFQVNYKQGR